MVLQVSQHPSTREAAVDAALAWFDSGAQFDDLARRVAFRTESQETGRGEVLAAYLDDLQQGLVPLGFKVQKFANSIEGAPPFLVAERIESPSYRTVLMYGHGDVVRGDDKNWSSGLEPFALSAREGRWYGRGSADNKGQHSINLAALAQVLQTRGALGLNVKLLFEMGEETGSPGLKRFCETHKERLAADLFLASDGPRLNSATPTVFLGSRGCCNFEIELIAREGAHHSGNWGGLLKNPAVRVAHAIATLTDASGAILVNELKSPKVTPAARRALQGVDPGEPGGPVIEPWGDVDRTPAERVFASNALEVLAFGAGNPSAPVNAIPARAIAFMQLRFVQGCEPSEIVPSIKRHLDAHGFSDLTVRASRQDTMAATALDVEHPFVKEVLVSIERTTAKKPVLLPGLGGSLPNDCFATVLGLPTVWVPHSYPGCNQHAPGEHLLESVARESLAMMTGLVWDLGAPAP